MDFVRLAAPWMSLLLAIVEVLGMGVVRRRARAIPLRTLDRALPL
jgi:hypothetical protein